MGNEQSSMKWTIMIPTVPARRHLLARLLAKLEPQLEGYNDIELLILEDNRKREYGPKLQAMIDIAQGEYVNFLDDDDDIAYDYVDTLYPLMDGVDCVGFTGNISIEGGPWRNVYYSIEHNVWVDRKNEYFRNPQHLTPIRREHVEKIKWEGHYGADRDWSHRMAESGLLKTENKTDKVMYYYHAWQSQNREGVWR